MTLLHLGHGRKYVFSQLIEIQGYVNQLKQISKLENSEETYRYCNEKNGTPKGVWVFCQRKFKLSEDTFPAFPNGEPSIPAGNAHAA